MNLNDSTNCIHYISDVFYLFLSPSSVAVDVVAVAEVETATGVAAVALTVEDAPRRAPGAEVQENTADPRCPQGPLDDQTVKIAPIPGAQIEADRHSNAHKQWQI